MLGGILRLGDANIKGRGDHRVVDALAGTDAEKGQVDFGTTDDVHPIGPGHRRQLGHQRPELGGVAGLHGGRRPVQFAQPAGGLPVGVHDADHRAARGVSECFGQPGKFSRWNAAGVSPEKTMGCSADYPAGTKPIGKFTESLQRGRHGRRLHVELPGIAQDRELEIIAVSVGVQFVEVRQQRPGVAGPEDDGVDVSGRSEMRLTWFRSNGFGTVQYPSLRR